MELNKICWIGGTARAGKTSITKKIAENKCIRVYHTDDYFGKVMTNEHIVAKEEHPFLWGMQNAESQYDIVRKSFDEYIETVMGIHAELFGLVRNDVLNLDESNIVVVEGLSLLPGLLHKCNITNACFLVSPQEFFIEKSMRDSIAEAQADSDVLKNRSRAMMEFMRSHIKEKADACGYKIIPIDDEHTLDVNYRLIIEHFSLPMFTS